MTTPMPEDATLARVTEICLALPEAERTYTGQHARFLVRGKTFAYYLVDHHGDGIVGLTCKAPPGAAEAMIASGPVRFYRPDYLGSRGWVGLRLDLDSLDWIEVAELLTDSYRLIAPKRLVALVPHLPRPRQILD
ncbi:MAG: MmcQ/YjbR family DNA-binding protein [Dehalococcoidia bacterium]